MRSGFIVAPFVAAAYAATTTHYGTTLVPELSGSVTITSTYTYSNPATKYLTLTNSAGVVTGRPGVSGTVLTQPEAVTSQPPVATIPAGLPTGYATIPLNVSNSVTSFTVSVGKSTTMILGGADVSTVAGSSGGASGTAAGGRPHHGGGGSPTHGGQQASSASASASASSSGVAASNAKVASAGMLGLGALFAALL